MLALNKFLQAEERLNKDHEFYLFKSNNALA